MNNLEKHSNIIDRYNTYQLNKKAIWRNRFTWKGLYGDMPKNSISIVNFLKCGFLDNIDFDPNSLSFKKCIDRYAEKYIKWVKSKDDSYSDEEYRNMQNFFIGAFGEYFFMYMLQNVKCINAINLNTGKITRYDFSYVALRLISDLDYGVDLTGVLSRGDKSTNCVIQIKFWNPNIEGVEITNMVAQKAHSDAICNNFINNDENENIVICWLGNTNQVSKYLKANTMLYKHIVFIDSKALDYSINNKNNIFWENLKNEIIQLKNYF